MTKFTELKQAIILDNLAKNDRGVRLLVLLKKINCFNDSRLTQQQLWFRMEQFTQEGIVSKCRKKGNNIYRITLEGRKELEIMRDNLKDETEERKQTMIDWLYGVMGLINNEGKK